MTKYQFHGIIQTLKGDNLMFHAAWKNKNTGMIEDIDYENGYSTLEEAFSRGKEKVHENCKLIVLKVTKVSD